MTITKQVAVIISIAVILLGLAGYNFMNAQVWTRPTSQPPQNNVRVPINVGISSTTIQNAVGSLVFNRFAATDAVWSNAYCDSQGQNCQNLGSSATSAINYVQYAKDYCDLNVPNPGSTSLHGVKLAKGGFYDFYDKNGATSILEWTCKGPTSEVSYEIQNACGFSVINPGSVSLNSVRLKNGTNYDVYDSNGGTAILEWRCNSSAPTYIRNIETACGFRVPNPGSISLNGVVDRNGNFFDLYDNNNGTARLVWSCN